MATTQCPYCLMDIPSKAEVCHYCTRDVGRLIKAETKIKELERQIGKSTTSANKLTSSSFWTFRFPLWAFYVFSIISVVVLDLPDHYHEYVIAILSLVFGFIVSLLNKETNVWMLLLFGFVQPFMATIALIIFGMISLQALEGLLPVFFRTSFQIGTAAAFGGLIALVFSKQRIKIQQFSLAPFFDWMVTTESRLDRVEKIILKIAALITASTLLISNLLSLSK